ncbi:MAG: efflux RND transporter periplasmic adaptor subunit [Chryseolinea sp.]
MTIIVTCNFFTNCSDSRANRKIASAPELSVMTLKASNFTIPKEYICEISAEQYVEIHARVQGYLEDIYVDEGKSVKKGDPLFRLSSNDYKEAITRAEANLQKMIAEAKAKKFDVERIKLMVDKDVISKTQLDVASAQQEASESAIKEARSILDNAKINLGYTYIRAPFDGIIDRIPYKIGSLINSGTLLTSVSNINEVLTYFKVSETEYLKLSNGELVDSNFKEKFRQVHLILADGTKYPEPGYVETIEGDFDRETGSIAFRARFPNPKKLLKHGSSGKIVMEKSWDNAILVPQESAFNIQDKNYVYLLAKGNVARATPFETVGRTDKDFIVTGLKPGDKIVVEGISQLRDGMLIRPRFLKSEFARVSLR